LTGQIAFDFIRSERDGTMYAIECNPRTHTAIALYTGDAEWAKAYVAALDSSTAEAFLAASSGDPLVPAAETKPVYWIGHELFDALRFRDMRTLAHRLLWEREAHWDVEDPLPWLALYHFQWPVVFLKSLLGGRRWTRINASTGKVFWC
jgi:hypothetical protein